MKILLTGATSFLGQRFLHTADLKEHNIIPISLSGDISQHIVSLNLQNFVEVKNLIDKEEPQIIIHTASLVNLSREYAVAKDCIEINTIGTLNLLEAIKEKKNTLFIYISSEEVYGNGPIPFKEEQQLMPPSPYAISKVAAENLCEYYFQEYLIPLCIVRLGTFYGPEQPRSKYFSQLIMHAIKNEPLPLNSGKKKRDYLYIDDAVHFLEKLVQISDLSFYSDPLHQKINVTGGKSYQLLDVVNIILELTHSRSSINIGAIPDRITERDEWSADIQKAHSVFNWTPTIDLHLGLSNMVKYYLETL